MGHDLADRCPDMVHRLRAAHEPWWDEVSLEAGEISWSIPTDSSVGNRVAPGAGGRAFALSLAGRLYRLDLRRGELLSTVDLPQFPERFVATRPVAPGEDVFVSPKSGCGCWNIETGA